MFVEYKIRYLATYHGKRRQRPMRIPDFGSDIGASVLWVQELLPNADIPRVDVSCRSLDSLKFRYRGLARVTQADERVLPFGDITFYLVFGAGVFPHINHSLHLSLLANLYRFLGSGGCLVVFQHKPLTVRAVKPYLPRLPLGSQYYVAGSKRDPH